MEKRKVGCTYNGILFTHKKEESLQTATTWMDLEGIMLKETIQTEKDEHCFGCLSFTREILK